MSYASAPTELSLLTEWRPDYVVAGVLVLTAVAYVRMRRTASRFHLPWRRHRDVVFAAGLAILLWTCNGFPQARGFQLMWVWMAQESLLLLVVPIVLMSAQPLALIRATYGDRAWPNDKSDGDQGNRGLQQHDHLRPAGLNGRMATATPSTCSRLTS